MADLRVTMKTGAEAVLEEGVVEACKASLRGPLLRAGDAGYDEARTIWNGMIDRRPALIARCAGVADVIQCVNFARAHHLLVAVRGGGHNASGNAVCDGGVMLDLSRMKGMRVDAMRRTARAEPGLTWGEFDHETQAFGLATTGGQISTTGIAGLTLGGGWGYLARKYGLASDNLLSADLVMANGQLLTASATEHADLFWGVRGGGGNFGVVTSFEYQLHPVGPVLAGVVIHPFEKAKAVLTFYREFARAAPDELASGVVCITMPDGTPVTGIVVCYNGPLEVGEGVLKPLRAFGTPLADQIGLMPYTAAQKLVDAVLSAWAPGILQGELPEGAQRGGDRHDGGLLRQSALAHLPRSDRTHIGWRGESCRPRGHRIPSPGGAIQLHKPRDVYRPGRGRDVRTVGARVLGRHATMLDRRRVRQLSRSRGRRGCRTAQGRLWRREVPAAGGAEEHL
jgi:hypothetical protein